MTDQFVDANKMVPITPPPELLARWEEDWHHAKVKHVQLEDHMATQAARWGADQELEACCEWLVCNYNYPEAANPLRTARRPNPQSLNEVALQMLSTIERDAHYLPEITDTIRRALEALDD